MRIGAIGAGWWATDNHFPLLQKRQDVKLVSVCRLGADELAMVAETFGFAHATEDYRELLEQDLDAVVVTSPHHLHFEHTMAALHRGLHVLVEKPMALRASEAWQIVQLASKQHLHVLVPLGWNYKNFIMRAKQLIDDSAIGEIEYVLCHMASPSLWLFTGNDPAARFADAPVLMQPDLQTWQAPTQGGGYAHGQLTHAASLLFWLTGLRATAVSALTSGPGAPIDLYNTAHVVFDNDAIGTISGAATLPDGDKFQVDIRVFGSQGALLLDAERERAEVRRRDGRHQHVTVEPGEGAYTCEAPVARFIDLITGASEVNNSPPDVAARAVELVDAILRSAANGGTRVNTNRSTISTRG